MTERATIAIRLNLPKTAFPMKAELPKREPDRIAWWSERRTYERRLERNRAERLRGFCTTGRRMPTASCTWAHFLNMVLKDMFVKIALLDGQVRQVRSRLGHARLADRTRNAQASWASRIFTRSIRSNCARSARSARSFGSIASARHASAWAISGFASIRTARSIRRSKRPSSTRSPISPRSSSSTRVCARRCGAFTTKLRWPKPRSNTNRRSRLRSTCASPPTTRSAKRYLHVASVAERSDRQATVDPDLDDDAVDAAGQRRDRAAPRRGVWSLRSRRRIARCSRSAGAQGAWPSVSPMPRCVATRTGRTARRHSRCVIRLWIANSRRRAGRLRRSRNRNRRGAHGARTRRRRLRHRREVRVADSQSGRCRRALHRRSRAVRRRVSSSRPTPQIIEDLRASGALLRASEIRAFVSALLALPQSGDLPRDRAMVHRDGSEPACGSKRHRRDRRRRVHARVGTHASAPDDRDASRVVHLASAHLGHADSGARLHARATNRSSIRALRAMPRSASPRSAPTRWWSDPVRNVSARRIRIVRSAAVRRFEKEKNIVDIWFESGVTHLAVLGHDGMPWPGDLCSKAAINIRGWFRSSLMTGVAIKGGAPYKHVVKNGWVNDEQGRADVEIARHRHRCAREAMEKWGADVLRLWAASVEFVDDVRFGPNVVEQVGTRLSKSAQPHSVHALATSTILTRRCGRRHANDGAARPISRAASPMHSSPTSKRLRRASRSTMRTCASSSSRARCRACTSTRCKDPLYSRAAGDPRRRAARSRRCSTCCTRFADGACADTLVYDRGSVAGASRESLRGDAESIFDTIVRARGGGEAPIRRPRTSSCGKRRAHCARAWRPPTSARSARNARDRRAHPDALPAARRRWATTCGSAGRFAARSLRDGDRRATTMGTASRAFELAAADGTKCQRCWKYRALGVDPLHPYDLRRLRASLLRKRDALDPDACVGTATST